MLTFQFIPYYEIENLPSENRITKLLDAVKNDKIVLLEGKLRSEEEAELIKRTMEQITEEFTGIELSVIKNSKSDDKFTKKIKSAMLNVLLGDRSGLTIIGPANIVKEIKQEPDKIQLYTNEKLKTKRK